MPKVFVLLLTAFASVVLFTGTGFGKAPPRKLSDSQIAAILTALSVGNIEAGKLAQAKAAREDIKEYAGVVVLEHTQMKNDLEQLIGRIGIRREENPTSTKIDGTNGQTRMKLTALGDQAFDNAYLAQQVAFHALALDEIKNILAPSAKNAELKQLLSQMAPKVETQLKRTKRLLKTGGVKEEMHKRIP